MSLSPSRRRLQHSPRHAADDEDVDDDNAPAKESHGGTGALPHRHRHSPSQPPPSQSGAFLEALSDSNSLLSQFLLRGGGGDGGDDDNGGMSWFASFRRGGGGTDGDGEGMRSMGKREATFCALTLEPLEVRNQRILMSFEAYAIFGALFMNAVWIIYEWGSHKSYGGDGTNLFVDRVFEFVMNIALGCNVVLALFSAMFWLYSINFNSSHEDFAIESMEPLRYLHILQTTTLNLVFVGLLLGIYSNLNPHLPEAILATIIIAAIQILGHRAFAQFVCAIVPLEIYHQPWSTKLLLPPLWRKQGREDMETRAKLRAGKLTKRAYRERKRLDPGFEARGGNASPVGIILSKAATNLGRAGYDCSSIKDRLEEDWFFEPDQLKDESVDFLARYMPHRLAREVHTLLEVEHSD